MSQSNHQEFDVARAAVPHDMEQLAEIDPGLPAPERGRRRLAAGQSCRGMADQRLAASLDQRARLRDDDLLLSEMNHRCSNDLQLVVSLLGLQSRRATNEETRQALNHAAERVAVLARARAAMNRDRAPSLKAALEQVCEALRAQAEPRAILVSARIEHEVHSLSSSQVTTLALVVNELATNAIKHAFAEGESGRIQITVDGDAGGDLTVIVEDDGRPFASHAHGGKGGLGLGLAKRLMASIEGKFIPPLAGSKAFELRVPVALK